jgi:glyoxylate/hydroxypyruvate reductase A
MAEDFSPEDIRMAAVWKHPEGSLSVFSNLLGIHGLGAGVDFILEDATIPPAIPVLRVVDPYLASDMAEYVLAHTLAHIKQIHRYQADQLQGVWAPVPYKRFGEVTVGIMGLGQLGRAVSRLLQANGFSLVGWTRTSKPEMSFPVYTGNAGMAEFLRKSQVLVCLLPLTPLTRGILNGDLFGKLPRGSFLINVARGPLLVDDHLIEALDAGRLSGACLDVFHQEPLPGSHPFWRHPLVHMTPHVASVSDPASVAPQVISNYRSLLKGVVPSENRALRTRGY